MTEGPVEQPPRQAHPPDEPEPMPRWVPVAIGVVLVALAALAVITGLRYRDDTLVNIVRSRADAPRSSPAPPGEPEAGASRVFPGESGANVPQANEPVTGQSRAEISGGREGVTAVVRMWARRGMQIRSEPRDAVVYVNEVPVGTAREFDADEEVYDFAEPGSYNVRIHAPGFKERHFVVTASPDAAQEVARIEVKLEKQ